VLLVNKVTTVDEAVGLVHPGFSLAPHLADAYAELVAGLTERFYERVTRFTSSAFLRLKLGASLVAHHVRPAMYESQRQALRSLKGSEPESKSRS